MTYLGEEKPNLEDLVHFGVKGMKWGIRRDPDRGGGQSTETKAERRQSANTLREHMWDRVKDEPMFRTMKQSDYDALSKRGETFVAGTSLKRISSSPDTTLQGATFVSKYQADSNFYKAVLPAVGPNAKGFGGGRKQYKQDNYEIVLKTTRKLKSPSEKERVDAFIELLSEPSIKMPGKKAPITGRQYLEKQGYKSVFKKPTDKDLAFKTWHDFLGGHGEKDNPLNKAYFDKLSLKGYNIMIDDNDAGRYAKKPLVILDPSAARVTNVHKLTTDEINEAQRRLTM